MQANKKSVLYLLFENTTVTVNLSSFSSSTTHHPLVFFSTSQHHQLTSPPPPPPMSSLTTCMRSRALLFTYMFTIFSRNCETVVSVYDANATVYVLLSSPQNGYTDSHSLTLIKKMEEINWIVVVLTFVVGAIAAYMIFGSKKKTSSQAKSNVSKDLPSDDLLNSDSDGNATNIQNEAGTFSQIERLEKPCKVEPRIIQFNSMFFIIVSSSPFSLPVETPRTKSPVYPLVNTLTNLI